MKVEHAIHIAAPPALVWSVTQDIERWPEWTPTVTSVKRQDEGPFRLGSIARIKQPLQAESEWVVTELTSGERFAWESSRRGLHFKGVHEVQAHRDGTRNVLRVEVTGALAVVLWPVLRAAMRRALSDENHGLKRHCEDLARGRG